MPSSSKRRLIRFQQSQHLMYIAIFTLVAVMVWVGGSIFQSQQRTGISPELQALAEPLNPNIDVTTIDFIETKRFISEDELTGFPILKVVTVGNNRNQLVVPLDFDESAFEESEVQIPETTPAVTDQNETNQNSATDSAVIDNPDEATSSGQTNL